MTTRLVIAGDIGGTNTRLLASELHGDGRVVDRLRERFASQEHPSLEAIASRFLASLRARGVTGPVVSAAVGVAGPVVDGASRLTNLRWVIEPGSLARALECPRARVLNDFHCLALAAPTLPADALAVLQRPAPRARLDTRPYAIIGAGTGLGEAIAVSVGGRLRVRMVGSVFAVLSRYAALFWNQGLHQGASLSVAPGTRMDWSYKAPLYLSMTGFGLLFLALVLAGTRTEIRARRARALISRERAAA